MYSNREFLLPSIATIAAVVVAILWFLFGKREIRQIPNTTITNNITTTESSASESAADSVAGVYEVFLSFCGIDTRNGFTDFLHTYLIGASIRTFRDDNELRVGEEIGFELLKAIKESKISIPIFSKNYASSKWCLLELVQMVECHKNGGQMIYPIFYDVDPSDVRNQKGCYEKAFRLHKKKFDEETVGSWREALKMVGQLKGLELKKETGGREGELVKIVVEKVLLELKKNYTHVPKNLVGMDNHIKQLNGLLKLDSKGVRIVGIHGMGGLGKTTIAKVIFNQLYQRFEGCCFLDNVRENFTHRDGILNMQKQLISKIQNRKVPKFFDIHDGSSRIKDVVNGRKILLVLDDVDEIVQIDMLMGNQTWFGANSRIIITTRNKGLLYALEQTCQKAGQLEVYSSYKPKLMDDADSLTLFSKYAFMSDSPPKPYDILSKKVVSTAAGLPLVLVTLGSSLFGENDIDIWDEKLRKLKEIPEKEVLEKLRVSFDPLDNGQKQIFLDIACFFVGEDKRNPCYMWDDCKFYPRDGLNVLVRKSLITVEDDNTLRMHDQLRDLGRQIICEGNFDELGKWSRLWCKDKALAMFKTRQGTEQIKAIGLNSVEFRMHEARTSLVGEDFGKLPNLRYLTLGDADLDGDFENLLSNLRWLQWKGCSVKFTPTNFHLQNLVILDLSYSYITNDWDVWSQIKMSKKLKVLILSYSQQLNSGPNLSAFRALERLQADGCKLMHTLDGIEELESLRYLNTTECESLKRLPNLSKLTKLEELDVLECINLIEIPGLHKLESLEVLNIGNCSLVEKLPNLANLKKLKTLNASGCYKLAEFQGLDRLDSLEYLMLSYCRSLKRLPNLSNLKRLKTLDISLCGELIEIQGLDELCSLQLLDTSNCESLERLPNLSNLKRLKRLDISMCDKLIKIPGLGGLESLEYLDMSSNGCVERVSDDLSILKRLRELNTSSCEALIEIPGLGELISLENLDMFYCKSLKRLPNFSNLKSLKKLNFASCEALIEIEGLDKLESLEQLNMRDCGSIERLPDLPNFGNLKEIDLSACYKLTELKGLEVVESLETLDISFCDSLGEIIFLPKLKNLTKLVICFLAQLNEIRGLEEMKSLVFLSINGCKSIQTLPDFSDLKRLQELNVTGCLKLTEFRGLEKLESLKKLNIRGCVSLENLPYLPNTTIEKDYDIFVDNEEIMDFLSS